MSAPAELLSKLRALDAAATKGPWKVSDSHGLCVAALEDARGDGTVVAFLDLLPGPGQKPWEGKRADAELMVALRNGLPELLEALAEQDPVPEGADARGNKKAQQPDGPPCDAEMEGVRCHLGWHDGPHEAHVRGLVVSWGILDELDKDAPL